MSSFKPPQEFSPGTCPAEDWNRWRQRFELYCAATDISSKPIAQQRAILLHVLGDTGYELYVTLQIPENGDALTIDVILDAITAHFTPYRNTTYKRYLFFMVVQSEGQTIDQFVTELRTKVRDCEFGTLADSLIRDRIICGIKNHLLRERLLREANLTLTEAIDICRADEVSRQQSKTMDLPKSESTVSVMTKHSTGKYFKRINKTPGKHQSGMQLSSGNFTAAQRSCTRCNKTHPPKQCPAFGKRCLNCSGLNHYAVSCRKKNLHAVCEEEEELFLGSLFAEINEVNKSKNEWIEHIEVNNATIVPFKIDTGSQVNILPENHWKELQNVELQPTNERITAYSGHVITVKKGACKVSCQFRSNTINCKFYIVDTNSPPILGLQSSELLGLFKRVDDLKELPVASAKEMINKYDDLFTGIGKLPGKHKIRLKDNAIPTVCAARKIPIGLEDAVKKELQAMERNNIIQKVDVPTDWVNPIVVVPKKSGEVRICLDPRALNESIKREHYSIPVQDEIFSKLEGATHFTVLDAASAFWQVELDEESSFLCTFATPYGRYRFLRMPYGIVSAPEVYQRAMHMVIEGLFGTTSYFDDLLVYGKGIEEHNKRLGELCERSRENNLKFKKEKLQLAVPEIKFIGHEITSEGIRVDSEKVKAIKCLSTPTSKAELLRFLGILNYLTRFVPNLSTQTAYLRNLTHKNAEFHWDEQAEKDFNSLKNAVSSAPVLRFFNPKEPIVLSVDASQSGLGAVILQGGLPIAYASVKLTQTQVCYPQIDKELLAIVYGCEHFHYYLYGTQVTVQTDHKPLLSVVKKPLENLSPRLQRMVLRLQRYQLNLVYVPGKELLLADALSRDPVQTDIVNTDYLEEATYKIHILVKATDDRLEELRKETLNDPELLQVIQYINQGWPSRKSQVKDLAKQYWALQDQFHFTDGLLMRGQRIVIPKAMQGIILKQIHSAHQGVVACKSKARVGLFWFGMASQIEKLVLSCKTCQENSRTNCKEPVLPHPIPQCPWERVAVDIMKLNSVNYLLVTDYFSKYHEVKMINSLQAKAVCNALKSIFSRFGIPSQLISDNGPPFNSEEFHAWMKSWNKKHVTSSPGYPKSNGMIERSVKTVKNSLKKAFQDRKDMYLTLLELRTTPIGNLPSPEEMLIGRRLRTLLPCAESLLEPQFDTSEMKVMLQKNQLQQKHYADKGTKLLSKLNQNQPIMMQKASRMWVPGTVVTSSSEPRSYIVSTDDGGTYRRNRHHLRERRAAVAVPETVNTPLFTYDPGNLVQMNRSLNI